SQRDEYSIGPELTDVKSPVNPAVPSQPADGIESAQPGFEAMPGDAGSQLMDALLIAVSAKGAPGGQPMPEIADAAPELQEILDAALAHGKIDHLLEQIAGPAGDAHTPHTAGGSTAGLERLLEQTVTGHDAMQQTTLNANIPLHDSDVPAAEAHV
ncbi:MAG: hypothetical protein WCY11_19725, partial [Novosphingobium sp.]